MKTPILLSLSALLATMLPAFSDAVPSVPSGTYTKEGWTLEWAEEFNGTGLVDSPDWDYAVGFIRNGEAQYYTDRRKENLEQRDGCLVITARKEPFPNAAYEEGSDDWRKNRKEAEYTSANIETSHKRLFLYGRVEFRAQMPNVPGAWPAIWMMGEGIRLKWEDPEYRNWPTCGEIDMLEMWCARPNTVYTTLHTSLRDVKGWENDNHKSIGGGSVQCEDRDAPWNGFHTYTMDWDEHNLYFYYDGTMYNHVNLDEADLPNGRNPFRHPMYIIVNLALGGWDNALSDRTIFPMEMKVDYIRYYKRTPEP